MVAVALGATWAGGWPFAALWAAASIAVAAEWTVMTRVRPLGPVTLIIALGLAASVVFVEAGLPSETCTAAAITTAFLVLVLCRGTASAGWALAGFVYGLAIALVPVIVRDRPDLGLSAVLWMFAVVWTTDIAAFFVGRRFGGPKLWPAVSPGKTWSGCLGGLLGAVAAGLIVAVAAARLGVRVPVGLATVALGSAVASLASQIGDLAESAMKRTFAVKDSGNLIPGHGGAMDRLDGFAAVALLIGLALAGARLIER